MARAVPERLVMVGNAVQHPRFAARFAGFGSVALVVIAGLIWALPGWLDWNHYRGAIARVAAAELGRPVRIDGPISVTLLPSPLITAERVQLGDRGDGVSLAVPALRLQLEVAPLLLGRLVPRALVLYRAAITLPWPLPPAALSLDQPGLTGAASARIEDGRLAMGALRLVHLDADLAIGASPAAFVLQGTASGPGGRWRFHAQLDPADAAGDAPIDVAITAAEATPTPDIAGRFTGRLTHAGLLEGRVSAHTTDLAALMPAPHGPASVDGTVVVGGGPVQGQLALSLGETALTVRLQPSAANTGQTVTLAAGRIDLDAWIAARGGAHRRTMLPTLPWVVALDLSVDALRVQGGLIAGLHARVDLDRDHATLTSATAILPGEAKATLTGRLSDRDGFSLAGDGTIDAPQLRATLTWLASCGVRLGADLPPEVLRSARFAGHITADHARVALDGLNGTIEQTKVDGSIGIDTASGAVDAALHVERIEGDDWLPPGTELNWPALRDDLAPLTLALNLRADQLVLRGETVTGLVLDAATDAGGLAVNGMDFDVDGLHGHLAGTIDGDGEVSDAHVDLGAASGSTLATHLPPWAHFTSLLWSGPVQLHLEANGPQRALIVSLALDFADAKLDAHPTIDLDHGTWSSQVTLRHPGAQRLLGTLGFWGAQGWLGEGSLSLLAQLSGAPGLVRADSADLTAGTLHATGAMQWAHPASGPPALTGSLSADTLPVPVFTAHDPTPLPLAWLTGWDARLALSAKTIAAGTTEVLHGASAVLELADGLVLLHDLNAGLGGGTLSGQAVLDSAVSPPHLAVQGRIAAASLATPLFGTRLDLTSGRIDASLDLVGQGYSPQALRASLSGAATLSARGGSLAGLSAGPTLFDTLGASVSLANGIATLRDTSFADPGGTTEVSGEVDLPDGSLNLLVLAPNQPPRRIAGSVAGP